MRSLADSHAVFHEAAQRFNAGGCVMVLDPTLDVGMVGVSGEGVSADVVNFLIQRCRGPIYVGVLGSRLDRLGISSQPADGGPVHHRVPVDLIEGVTTGISARDRALTIRAVLNPHSEAAMFRQPGHVTPLEICEGGTFSRIGMLEALWDLFERPSPGAGVVLAIVLDETGEYADQSQLSGIAAEHGMPLVTIADVVRHRRSSEDAAPGPADEARMLRLPHLRKVAYFHVVGEPHFTDEVPTVTLELCAGGHVLGLPCACRERWLRARSALESAGGGLLGVVADDELLLPGCPDAAGARFHTALADLLAAYAVGAVARPASSL